MTKETEMLKRNESVSSRLLRRLDATLMKHFDVNFLKQMGAGVECAFDCVECGFDRDNAECGFDSLES